MGPLDQDEWQDRRKHAIGENVLRNVLSVCDQKYRRLVAPYRKCCDAAACQKHAAGSPERHRAREERHLALDSGVAPNSLRKHV
jgi:hypothetical protein